MANDQLQSVIDEELNRLLIGVIDRIEIVVNEIIDDSTHSGQAQLHVSKFLADLKTDLTR